MHQDFKFAGQLPPLVTPNHLLEHEWLPYREGVVLSEGPSGGSLIDVGLKLVSTTFHVYIAETTVGGLGSELQLRLGRNSPSTFSVPGGYNYKAHV